MFVSPSATFLSRAPPLCLPAYLHAKKWEIEEVPSRDPSQLRAQLPTSLANSNFNQLHVLRTDQLNGLRLIN